MACESKTDIDPQALLETLRANLAAFEGGLVRAVYVGRYKPYFERAIFHMDNRDWQNAGEDFYSALCEHPAKYHEGMSEDVEADRAALGALSEFFYAKHLAAFEVGKRVQLPSGLGGVFCGPCTGIDGDNICITIENAHSGFNGKTWSASYKEARRI